MFVDTIDESPALEQQATGFCASPPCSDMQHSLPPLVTGMNANIRIRRVCSRVLEKHPHNVQVPRLCAQMEGSVPIFVDIVDESSALE